MFLNRVLVNLFFSLACTHTSFARDGIAILDKKEPLPPLILSILRSIFILYIIFAVFIHGVETSF